MAESSKNTNKRPRTNTDVDKQLELYVENSENVDLRENIEILKAQIDEMAKQNTELQQKNEIFISQITNLTEFQKSMVEQMGNIQNTMKMILENQQKNTENVKKIEKITNTQTEKIEKQIQKSHNIIEQKQTENANKWTEIVRKTNKNNVDLTQKIEKSQNGILNKSVQNNNKNATEKSKPISWIDRRIILCQSTNEKCTQTEQLEIRNSINKILVKNDKNIAIISVTQNDKNTLIATTRENCTKFDVLKYKNQIMEQLQKLQNVEIIDIKPLEFWAKLIVHGVSTERYTNTAESMNNLFYEIENMNLDAKLMTAPRWLTDIEKRKSRHSSIVIAIDTFENANKFLQRGLWIDGKKLKCEKFLQSKPTDQCSNCQNFGHHNLKCVNETKCGICAGNHLTKNHFCKICNKSGQPCTHIKLICVNCKKQHQSNDKHCEMFISLQKSNMMQIN